MIAVKWNSHMHLFCFLVNPFTVLYMWTYAQKIIRGWSTHLWVPICDSTLATCIISFVSFWQLFWWLPSQLTNVQKFKLQNMPSITSSLFSVLLQTRSAQRLGVINTARHWMLQVIFVYISICWSSRQQKF